jgi:hypothetical protein
MHLGHVGILRVEVLALTQKGLIENPYVGRAAQLEETPLVGMAEFARPRDLVRAQDRFTTPVKPMDVGLDNALAIAIVEGQLASLSNCVAQGTF